MRLRQGGKRFSKGGVHLADPSPLFILVYANAVEAIVYVAITLQFCHRLPIPKQGLQIGRYSDLENGSFQSLANVPGKLVGICGRLNREAEAVFRSNGLLNMLLF